MTRLGRRALLASLVVGAAGCSGAPASQPPTPSVTPTVPAGGQPLGALGIKNGPFLTVPHGIKPTRTIDQPNVVTILVSPADGRRLLDHLTANLPNQSWTITSSGGDSLIFTQPGWEGAFTLSTEVAGLTLRRVS